MFTSTHGPRKSDWDWRPNHFCPVLKRPSAEADGCSSDSCDVPEEVPEVSTLEDFTEDVLQLFGGQATDAQSTDSLPETEVLQERQDNLPYLSQLLAEVDKPHEVEASHSEILSNAPVEKCKPKPFVELEEAFQYLLKPDQVHKDIPLGRKSNTSFVIKNENVNKFEKGHNYTHPADDKGAYIRPNVNTDVYALVDSRFVLVYPKVTVDKKTKAILSADKKVLGETELANKFVVRKAYHTVKKNHDLRRRCTYFAMTPKEYEVLQETCYVEYSGHDVDYQGSSETPHGNSLRSAQPWVRTKAAILDKARDLIGLGKKPKEVYQLCTDVSQPQNSLRNLDQVYSLKKNSKGKAQNSADEHVKIISELKNGPWKDFIQKFWLDKENRACMILYQPWQIDDLKQNCTITAKKPSTLGIDTTFNCGECYVTPSVYQNNNVRRKNTGTNPVVPGPIFIHWDRSYVTYDDFIHHLRVLVRDADPDLNLGFELNGELLIGSDEEKGLTKAIEDNFPNGVIFLCAEHLKEGTKRQLKNVPNPVKNQTLDSIYGKSGMTSAENQLDFSEKVLKVDATVFQDPHYFEDLKCKLWNRVVEPRLRADRTTINWSNNPCESFNHLIKNEIGWTPQKLIPLVGSLKNLVDYIHDDLKASITGRGNLVLEPHMEKPCYTNLADWSKLSVEAQDRIFNKLIRGAPRREIPSTVTSSDGLYTMKNTCGIKKKPNQKTRARPTRTRSAPKGGRCKKTNVSLDDDDDFEDEPGMKKGRFLLGFSKFAK